MKNELLALAVFDDKIEFRCPKSFKSELKKEAKAHGYSKLSAYVLALLLGRGKP